MNTLIKIIGLGAFLVLLWVGFNVSEEQKKNSVKTVKVQVHGHSTSSQQLKATLISVGVEPVMATTVSPCIL